MKTTVEDKIISLLRKKFKERQVAEWYNTGDLERKLSEIIGKTPGTINRTLRRMTEHEHQFIEKQSRKCLNSNKESMWYRYIPSEYDYIALGFKENTLQANESTPQ